MSILDYIEKIKRENEGPRIMDQESRNMKLAKANDIPDAFNPDLEQSEFLRPGETLEDWKPNPFLKPHAEGGRIGFARGHGVGASKQKLDQVIGAYRRYRRGEKNPKINFKRFFEIYAKENFADGGRIGFNDGKGVHLDAIGRQNTKSIEKEESLKKIFDKIFDEADWGGIKGEFPGVGKAEQEAGISKYHPTRRGKTGGKIPNQWYSQHVSKAIKGDVDALNDLARITGRSVEDLQGAFGKIEGAKLKVKSESYFFLQDSKVSTNTFRFVLMSRCGLSKTL